MFRPPVDRPPRDFRDEEEKAEVARILAVLPPDHPARLAHERGIDTIRLTHMVGDAPLVSALIETLLAGRDRIFRRSSRFRP
jgi:hypothetical protein